MPHSEHKNSSCFLSILSVCAIVFFLGACGLVSYRAYHKQSQPGEIVDARFDDNSAFRDFHNAVYFPVRAFVTGENPYSQEYQEFHPDGLGFPAFFPTTLAIHAPLGFLDVQVAQWLYMGINFLLMVLIVGTTAKFAGRKPTSLLVFGLAGVFVLTRPGVLNFYGVQVTLLHVLGCLLAIEHGQNRPKLAALGLFLASCKPTFTIPLAILMLCRGDWRAVTLGTLLSVAIGGATVGMIAENNGGLNAFIAQAKTTYLSAEGQPEIPEVITSWTRIDTYSILPRMDLLEPNSDIELMILGGFVLIASICVFAERDKDQLSGSTGRFGLLAVLTILISVYHQPYDALLLIIPLTILLLKHHAMVAIGGPVLKGALILLLGFPMLNFVGTQMVLNRLGITENSNEWQIIVTANAFALLAAFALIALRMLGSGLGLKKSTRDV